MLGRVRQVISDDLVSFVLVADQADGGQRRDPPFDFVAPIGQGGFRHDHQVRAVDVFVMLHVAEQTDGLQCFTETLCAERKDSVSFARVWQDVKLQNQPFRPPKRR